MVVHPPDSRIIISPKGEQFTYGDSTWTNPPENVKVVPKNVFAQWSHNAKRIKYEYKSKVSYETNDGPNSFEDSDDVNYIATASMDYSVHATEHPFPANEITEKNLYYSGQYHTTFRSLDYDDNDSRVYLPYQIYPFIHRDGFYIYYNSNLSNGDGYDYANYTQHVTISPTKFTINESVESVNHDAEPSWWNRVTTTTISLEITEKFYQ